MFYIWKRNGIRAPFETGRTQRALRLERTTAVRPISVYQSMGERRQNKVPERALVAAQIMTSPVITLDENTKISDSVSLIQKKRFRHVPITSKAGVLTGILTDRNLLNLNLNHSEAVKSIATPEVITALPTTEIREIAKLMFEERIGSVPIVSVEGALVGIITRSDILRTVMNKVPFELWI
jgi:acetoin utilization protein AcuB